MMRSRLNARQAAGFSRRKTEALLREDLLQLAGHIFLILGYLLLVVADMWRRLSS
jgi:hypothetical protein